MFFLLHEIYFKQKRIAVLFSGGGGGGSSRRHILAEKDYIQRLHGATMETFYRRRQAGLPPVLYRGGLCRGAYDRDYCR